MKALKDRVAVITGAGGGLGRALAVELASRGCHLALVDVNTAAVEETAKAVSDRSIQVSRHVTDVTDTDRMRALPAEVVAAHGRVHILIHNAGITIQKNFATHSMSDSQNAGASAQ